ncbi:MAG: type III secretion system inner membrane ring subunit SctD [Chlamydia sp.]
MNENNDDIVFNDEERESLSETTHVDFDLLDVEGRWLLKVISGPNTGAEFSIQSGSSYLIGTDATSCDIIFQDLSVSRRHAKIAVDAKNRLTIEDLQSKNGTSLDGEKITQKSIESDVLVSIGTTAFLLLDKEGERTTIAAPILYAQLQKTDIPEEDQISINTEKSNAAAEVAEEPQDLTDIHSAVLAPLQSEIDRIKEEAKKKQQAQLAQAKSSLGMLSIVTLAILTIGVGTATLFRTEDIRAPYVADPEKEIKERISDFPAIRFSYNSANNRLLLIGHVLTSVDRSRMIDSLQRLKFISNIDCSNVVIDELVYKEINQILTKDPEWRSISISSPIAGKYVLNGFLKTKDQADRLYDYLSQNFPYIDLLERNVLVEQETLRQITQQLNQANLRTVYATIANGEVSLAGSISNAEREKFSQMLESLKSIHGIRSLQIKVDETGNTDACIDISPKYRTTGYSQKGAFVSVLINGRILSTGDSIDGMSITSITPSTVFLERGGVKYKIDFNR